MLFKGIYKTAILFSLILSLYLLISTTYAETNLSFTDNFQLRLNNAQFKKCHINHLTLKGNQLHLDDGKVNYLNIAITGFKNKDIFLDKLALTTQDVTFSSDKLISEQKIELKRPVKASVTVTLSEDSLNSILNRPKTLKELSKISRVKIKKFGVELNGGLISFLQPRAKILYNNTIRIDMLASLGNMVSFPVSFSTTLSINQNKLKLTSPRLVTSGISIPDEITGILNTKLNAIIAKEENKLKDDADIKVTSIRSIPGKSLLIKAAVVIKKLKFDKKSNKNN